MVFIVCHVRVNNPLAILSRLDVVCQVIYMKLSQPLACSQSL